MRYHQVQSELQNILDNTSLGTLLQALRNECLTRAHNDDPDDPNNEWRRMARAINGLPELGL